MQTPEALNTLVLNTKFLISCMKPEEIFHHVSWLWLTLIKWMRLCWWP